MLSTISRRLFSRLKNPADNFLHQFADLQKIRMQSTVSQLAKQKEDNKNIMITKEGKVFKITFDRPHKFNALTLGMYEAYGEALRAADNDPDTSVTVVTGNGDYYCSGNDLSNFSALKTPESTKQFADFFRNFVDLHIQHKKPLIALVNGPAIGIAVTLLGLADLAIASDKATFHTPFTVLGQSPEGCSSYTFPNLMGTSKSTEILLFGKKLTAHEAFERNLIAEIIPHNNFVEDSMKKVGRLSNLPPESLSLNKQLLRRVHKNQLLTANLEEVKLLQQRWHSKECIRALTDFMNRKK